MKRRKKRFPFDYSPRAMRIEAVVTRGGVKQWVRWSMGSGRTGGVGQNQRSSAAVV
jgi:hypothetical protein